MRNPRLSKINFQSCLKKDPLKEKKTAYWKSFRYQVKHLSGLNCTQNRRALNVQVKLSVSGIY